MLMFHVRTGAGTIVVYLEITLSARPESTLMLGRTRCHAPG